MPSKDVNYIYNSLGPSAHLKFYFTAIQLYFLQWILAFEIEIFVRPRRRMAPKKKAQRRSSVHPLSLSNVVVFIWCFLARNIGPLLIKFALLQERTRDECIRYEVCDSRGIRPSLMCEGRRSIPSPFPSRRITQTLDYPGWVTERPIQPLFRTCRHQNRAVIERKWETGMLLPYNIIIPSESVWYPLRILRCPILIYLVDAEWRQIASQY